MKLISRPVAETEYIDTTAFGGHPVRVAGRTTWSDVQIVVEDKPRNTAEEMWRRLKYGTKLLDLELNKKYEAIIFEDEKEEIILHGVIPYEMERTACWEGRVFTCKIDYFEINEHG